MRILFFIFFLLVLQLLSFAFIRIICWVAGDKLHHRAQRLLSIIIFGLSNMLMVAMALRLWHGVFHMGAFWLVLMLFTVYAALMAAMLYGLGYRFIARQKLVRIVRVSVPLFFIGITLLALYNAYVPIVRHYHIVLDKPLSQNVRIGVASDLHLGKLFGKRALNQLANLMTQEKVDLILLPGDIMDDDVRAYRAQNMQESLMQLHAPLGVYAILGNHDLFGHQSEIAAEIRAAGITLLHDDIIELPQGISIIGRPDNMDKTRQNTVKLLQKVDKTRPIILLDHRPDQIKDHTSLPIDIQVSGHAHNGQIFPANFIVHAINRLAYGYEQIGEGHYFVTSGYGFWAVPLRLGSQSEILVIDVQGKERE